MKESFLDKDGDEVRILTMRGDGFWDIEPVIEVRKAKRKKKVTPIRGTKVNVADDSLLYEIRKDVSGDEKRKIEERTRTLEDIMPYEAKAFKKIKYGTSFDIGEPKQKVEVKEQPAVEKLDEVVDDVVRGILRNQYVTVGADGKMYQYQNMPRLLREKAKEKGLIKNG